MPVFHLNHTMLDCGLRASSSSGGQARLKPSPGIFFVASMPSLLPLAISLVAWSSTSDGLFRRQRDVHNLGEIHLEDRQEQFHARAADVKILHRRNADHRRRIHRVLPMRDGECEIIRARNPAAFGRVIRATVKMVNCIFLATPGRRPTWRDALLPAGTSVP